MAPASPCGQHGPRLPAIPLPNFTGSYEISLFYPLVENHSQIHNIEKFYFLRSGLQGEAAQIISSLAATENNYYYLVLLHERYETKKHCILNSFLNSIT